MWEIKPYTVTFKDIYLEELESALKKKQPQKVQL